MKNKKNNMKNKEIGDILAEETLRVSQMEMEANNTKKIDKKLWAFFHLGFVANMKLNGASDEDINEVVNFAQDKLLELTEDNKDTNPKE
jgi:hypothetical protein